MFSPTGVSIKPHYTKSPCKRHKVLHLSDEDVAKIIEKINSLPRKCLGFKTPNQLFLRPKQHVALESWIRADI
jgi:hypothetical protein